MASEFSHAIVTVALGAIIWRRSEAPLKLWLLGIGCAVVPDVDAFGFWLGIPYDAPLGHRGLTHSLAFAALLSGLVIASAFHDARWAAFRSRLAFYLLSATVSHGVLDAMTNGGLGVAFFAPFDNTRYFFPFRPIEVSPLSVESFFTVSGTAILWNELFWILLPSLLIAALFFVGRCREAAGHSPTERSSNAASSHHLL